MDITGLNGGRDLWALAPYLRTFCGRMHWVVSQRGGREASEGDECFPSSFSLSAL